MKPEKVKELKDRLYKILPMEDNKTKQGESTPEEKVSTKYIVLFTIFKAAWDHKPDAKDRFFAWFHEDVKKKRAALEMARKSEREKVIREIGDKIKTQCGNNDEFSVYAFARVVEILNNLKKEKGE
jgi:hypothetical protein